MHGGYCQFQRNAANGLITFLNLLAAIEPFISPQESYHGVPTVKANERLTLTLCFLATGETFRSLGFHFRISRSAISYIVISVCEALINHLGIYT